MAVEQPNDQPQIDSISPKLDTNTIEQRIKNLTEEAKKNSMDAGENIFGLLCKAPVGTLGLLVSLEAYKSNYDWKTTVSTLVFGLVIYNWAFRDVGESVHKFKLGGDLRAEARSLRAALDRHLLEAVE